MKIHIVFKAISNVGNDSIEPVRAWKNKEVADMVKRKLDKKSSKLARNNHNQVVVSYHTQEVELE